MTSLRFRPFVVGWGAALAGLGLAGLALLPGCVEQTSAPPPSTAVMPPPPPPPPPETQVVVEQPRTPPPAEPGRILYLRETPPPPPHLRMVDPGGLPPVGRVILVNAPPPPLRVEAIPRRPENGLHQVWCPGHWRYYAGRYIWIPGKWAVPPAPRAHYIPPHWEKRGEAHVFVEGYWQL